jgi:hypothetical protein
VDDDDRSAEIASLADGAPQTTRFPHFEATMESAVRVAGARELLEESSILLARRGAHWATPAHARDVLGQLARGNTLVDVLKAGGFRLALDALVPFAHFVTPRTEPRRFDTCFFLTVLPAGQRADPTGGESDGHAWVSPARAVAAGVNGGLRVPAPTLITLAQLAAHSSIGSALTWAGDRTISHVEPRVEVVDGRRIVTVPDEKLLPPDHPWWQPGGPRFVTAADGGWRPVTREPE